MHVVCSCLSTYSAQHLGGGELLKLDHMKVLLRLSEITTQDIWPLESNSDDSLYGRFSTATELSFRSCRFEHFVFAGHEATYRDANWSNYVL